MTNNPLRDFDVFVIGDINADLILSGDSVPQFGQVEKLLDDALVTVGGSAAIFACGAARLGLNVVFAGCVGNDAFGRYLIDSLAERGINVQGIHIHPDLQTGLTVILSHHGDRSLLTYPGAMSKLSAAAIDRKIFARSRHIHIGSYYMLDALRADLPDLLDEAKAQDCTISLDTNYDPTEQWDGNLSNIISQVDVFLPNEMELKAIAKQTDMQTAIRQLGQHIPIIAVKLGDKGAAAVHNGELMTAPILPVEVKDTTGAGDTFDAGFIYGFLADWSVQNTLKFACACGSLSTRGTGGTTTQPSVQEIHSHLTEG